jgi:Domain of unknown function (DUF6484)
MSVRDFVEVVLVDAEDSADSAPPDSPVARPSARGEDTPAAPLAGASIVRLYGFNLQDQPLVAGIESLPGEIVAARTTVALTTAQIGRAVVALFENGDPARPIIMGVLHVGGEPAGRVEVSTAGVLQDEGRVVLAADRELVLRCGDATITLTRAGKVIIKGRYIVSRSTGHNRIKGATVDIN